MHFSSSNTHWFLYIIMPRFSSDWNIVILRFEKRSFLLFLIIRFILFSSPWEVKWYLDSCQHITFIWLHIWMNSACYEGSTYELGTTFHLHKSFCIIVTARRQAKVISAHFSSNQKWAGLSSASEVMQPECQTIVSSSTVLSSIIRPFSFLFFKGSYCSS